MTTINITQEMRNRAFEFSTNIIMQNNQYDRMHPANVRDINVKEGTLSCKTINVLDIESEMM